ncbi:ABC transporter substrate-binding protein, partial [Citrobacter sp. AAK_AS5]
ATGETLVTISAGDTGGAISQSLYDAGVTKTPEAFYDHLVETAQNPTFYPGVYRLQQKMTSAAALTALQDPANKLENSALVR